MGGPVDVFECDAEAGRCASATACAAGGPATGARLFASYEFCEGARAMSAPGAIKGAPLLPSGFTASNPVPTWGGADAETVAVGREADRSATCSIATGWSAPTISSRSPGARPGVEIGRIDVLPACHPDLAPAEPAAAPGVVTLMAIPRADPAHPDAPRADRLFLTRSAATSTRGGW